MVTILGVIAAIIVPRVTIGVTHSQERVCWSNCGHINSAIERYRETSGVWPSADLNELDGHLDYFPEGIPTCPVTGEAYRLDTVDGRNRVLGHFDGNHSP